MHIYNSREEIWYFNNPSVGLNARIVETNEKGLFIFQ
jgi:hypothetical protein